MMIVFFFPLSHLETSIGVYRDQVVSHTCGMYLLRDSRITSNFLSFSVSNYDPHFVSSQKLAHYPFL